MKSILVFLFTIFISISSFGMGSAVMLRYPVGTPMSIDTSSTNITNAAWVQLIASTSFACSGLLVHNAGAQPIQLGKGAAASEVTTGLVLPIGTSVLIPIEIAKGTRLSLRSLGSTQSSGIITASCFQ